jgi:hypothetical protein
LARRPTALWIGGVVAGWFFSKDATSFTVVQMLQRWRWRLSWPCPFFDKACSNMPLSLENPLMRNCGAEPDLAGAARPGPDLFIMLLARMARFVIADISDAKSVLQELQAIVPNSPKLPVQSIIVATQEEPGMFDSFRPYPWFLPTHRYESSAQLCADLDERVIAPADAAVERLRT